MQETAAVRPWGTLVIVSIRTVQSPLSPGLRTKSLIPTEHCARHAFTESDEDRQDGLRAYGKKRQQARTFCQESSKQNREEKKGRGGGRMQWMHKRVSVRRDDKPET